MQTQENIKLHDHIVYYIMWYTIYFNMLYIVIASKIFDEQNLTKQLQNYFPKMFKNNSNHYFDRY